ncbi:MAG TPA: SDR family oxidoreductase [Chitinophagales bacterium]|nr:SDR family oxidoreductase [Chitinophagales bacterium]
MQLNGKTAIVTGASKGIGKAITLALLDKGVNVAGWSRSNPNINHPSFSFIQTDIRKSEQVDAAFEKTMKLFGSQIHILVNNAGLGIFSKLEETPDESWHTMFDTNVHGLFYCTRKVIPVMKEQQRGHLINISSIAGLTGIEEASGYCATKFAVRGISQSLFKEVRKNNIKVTCICPGSVNTDFFENVEDITANETMLHPKDIAASVVHILETPDNYVTVEVELRPINPRYS